MLRFSTLRLGRIRLLLLLQSWTGSLCGNWGTVLSFREGLSGLLTGIDLILYSGERILVVRCWT